MPEPSSEGMRSLQAAASGTLVEKLAAHLEQLWPVSEAVAALDSGQQAGAHGQPGQLGDLKGGENCAFPHSIDQRETRSIN